MPRSSRDTLPTSRESPTRLRAVSPAHLRDILITEASDVSDGESSWDIEREEEDEDEEIRQRRRSWSGRRRRREGGRACRGSRSWSHLTRRRRESRTLSLNTTKWLSGTAIKIDTAAPNDVGY